MLALVHLISLLGSFLRLAITPIKTTPNVSNFPQVGAMPDSGGLVNLFSSLVNNGSPAFGNWAVATINPDLAAATYSAQQLLGGLIRRPQTTGVATTDSTDTATNIVNQLPGAVVGQSFPVLIANLSSANLTVAGGTGVTLTGTAVIERFSTRLFLGQVTGSAAVTLTNCFEFGGAGANNF